MSLSSHQFLELRKGALGTSDNWASLSEPHINGKPMRNPYIFLYFYIYLYRGTSVISIAHHCIRSPADVRNNTLCAMTYAAEKRAWTLSLV